MWGGGAILNCVCVCFSMFVHAALSSALRSAGRPAPRPHLDLGPPATGFASADRVRFRSHLQDTVHNRMSPSAAPGDIRTFEAVLQSSVPKITDKLGSSVLPLVAEDTFFAVVGALSRIDPKSVSPATGQATVRRHYAKPVKPVVAFWNVVRGFERFSAKSGRRKWGFFGMVSSGRVSTPRTGGPPSFRKRCVAE